MGPTASGERTAKRTVALGIGAALASVLLVTTATIASTYTAQRVASNARALHWANSSLGTAALARASVGQAVFFGVDRDLGVASDAAVSAAVEVARRDLAVITQTARGSTDGTFLAPADVTAALQEFAATGTSVLDLIDQGDAVGAADAKASSLDPSFASVTDLLVLQQQSVAAAVSSTESLAGRIDTITRIGIMLVLPTMAFGVYRRRARRSMQEARKRHAADLEVERRAAIARDEFFAAVSHELRTPLTTILGFSEVLIDGSAHPGEQQEMMGLIRKDAIDLERRIDDLVAAARSAANGLNTEVDDFAIESAIADVVRASGVAAEVHTECESAEVRADPVAVRQIVRNLVSNAGRHGGPRVWVSGRVVGDRYLVAVSDNGPGFDPDVINTPRGPFAHDNQEAILEGTIGLGLGAAVALAEASKGSLVYRRVSGWTQVGLFLPLIPPAAPMHHLESELPEARTA